jgi:hypothetical protein
MELQLPGFRQGYDELARLGRSEGPSHEEHLRQLAERNCQERRPKRIGRPLWRPLEKNWQALALKRFRAKMLQQARTLLEESFVDRHQNVLPFRYQVKEPRPIYYPRLRKTRCGHEGRCCSGCVANSCENGWSPNGI